jgi:hypothetical protein
MLLVCVDIFDCSFIEPCLSKVMNTILKISPPVFFIRKLSSANLVGQNDTVLYTAVLCKTPIYSIDVCYLPVELINIYIGNIVFNGQSCNILSFS